LDLFETFAATGKPQNLSGLAALIDMPVSTCHGLVKTLQARGYLYSLGSPKRLYPTKRLLNIAERIAMQDPIVEYVGPALTVLRDTTGETAVLAKAQGDEVVYLEVIEGLHVIRYSARPGEFRPLHTSSTGKLVLGELPKDGARKAVARLHLEKITKNTVTDPDALLAEVAESRKRGYYVAKGEFVADVMGIAVPVKLSGDTFGIGLVGPVSRMQKKFESNLSALIACQEAVEGALT
jgi:DNA-binding IclR family transcriptional regulator